MKLLKLLFTLLFVTAVLTINCSKNPVNSDSSVQWKMQNSGTTRALTDVQFIDQNIGYIVGSSGTILKTVNGGLDWTSLNSPTSKSLRKMSFLSANTGYVVGNAGTIFKTTDGGNNWLDLSGNFSIAIQDVTFLNSNTGFIIVGHQIYKTTDGGTSWTAVYTYSGDIVVFTFREITFINNSIGYAIGGQTDDFGSFGNIVKTVDGGESWSIVSIDQINELFAMSFPDVNIGYLFTMYIYALPNVKIYKTQDGGETWSQPTNFDFGNPIIDSFFLNPNIGYAVADAGSIFETSNGGKTWSKQDSGVSSTLTSVYFVNSSIGYVVGNNGVILTTIK